MVSKKRTRKASQATDLKVKISNARRSAISVAVATALAGTVAFPDAARAQEEVDPDFIEEIVTVGVRSSILDSVNSKRNSDIISDVVDAGALGALPDRSIADALGRLPGVTTIRDSGQSSQLNIRGMNGDFIQTTLNGREQPSTAGYSEATRWSSFDQYPRGADYPGGRLQVTQGIPH